MSFASTSKSLAYCNVSGGRIPLSVADCVALLYLNSIPDERELPQQSREKLIGLGLATRQDGHILYTDQGRAMAAELAHLGERMSPTGAGRPSFARARRRVH